MQKQGIEQTPEARRNALYQKAFAVVLGGILLAVLVQAWVIGTRLDELFVKVGNDSVMRLVSVRNWLGGQGWFDTMEYRLVPPEGVLLHWSRYIDAMIGGMIIVFSSFLPTATAEILAITIWPTVLMIALVCAVGFGMRRLFGPLAACFAMLCVLTWPFTSRFYFRPGQIDHHNVQILMTALMTLAAIWPKAPLRSGIVAGLAASIALAVGLETLPYILALGLLLFLRATFAVTPEANRLLITFCITLAVGSVALWLGQTPADRLTFPVCDQLGMPVLSLIAIAGAASIIPFVLGLRSGIWRFAASLLVVGLGFAVAWPFLGPCLAGPYGSLPLEVQEIIKSAINEALPALTFAQTNALLLIKMMLPVIAAIVIAGVFWMGLGRSDADEIIQRDMIGQLLILCTIGLVAVFFQVRLFSMSAGALPLLAGFALATLLSGYLKSRSAGDGAKLIGATVLIITPFVVETLVKPVLPKRAQTTTAQDRNCRDVVALTALNAVPRSVVLTPMNIGPAVLLQTHHKVLSGPYHRSPEAFANGKIPFVLPEAEMQAYLSDIGAEHLVLCNGSNYGRGFATELAKGGDADWLRPIAVEAGDLLVFEIIAAGDS